MIRQRFRDDKVRVHSPLMTPSIILDPRVGRQIAQQLDLRACRAKLEFYQVPSYVRHAI